MWIFDKKGKKQTQESQESVLKNALELVFADSNPISSIFLCNEYVQKIYNVKDPDFVGGFAKNLVFAYKFQPVETEFSPLLLPIMCCVWANKKIMHNGIFYNKQKIADSQAIIQNVAESSRKISDLTIYHLDNDKFKICYCFPLSEQRLHTFKENNPSEFNDTIFLFQCDIPELEIPVLLQDRSQILERK
jgi:hypothetical protein